MSVLRSTPTCADCGVELPDEGANEDTSFTYMCECGGETTYARIDCRPRPSCTLEELRAHKALDAKARVNVDKVRAFEAARRAASVEAEDIVCYRVTAQGMPRTSVHGDMLTMNLSDSETATYPTRKAAFKVAAQLLARHAGKRFAQIVSSDGSFAPVVVEVAL